MRPSTQQSKHQRVIIGTAHSPLEFSLELLCRNHLSFRVPFTHPVLVLPTISRVSQVTNGSVVNESAVNGSAVIQSVVNDSVVNESAVNDSVVKESVLRGHLRV